MAQTKNVRSRQSFMYLHQKLLDLDHPLIFEMSKLKQIEAQGPVAYNVRNKYGYTYVHS